MPLANGSLSPIIFGSVRFYHGILVGPNIGVAVYDGSRRLSIFGVTTAAAGQLRTPPPHAPEVLTRPDKAGQWVAHPQDSYSATRNLVRFFPTERALAPIYYFRVTFREARSYYVARRTVESRHNHVALCKYKNRLVGNIYVGYYYVVKRYTLYDTKSAVLDRLKIRSEKKRNR